MVKAFVLESYCTVHFKNMSQIDLVRFETNVFSVFYVFLGYFRGSQFFHAQGLRCSCKYIHMVRLKRPCGYHWIRLVAGCSELEVDLTKPEFATSTGAVVLCHVDHVDDIILILTSSRLLHAVSDDSRLHFVPSSANKQLRVLKLKGWRVLI